MSLIYLALILGIPRNRISHPADDFIISGYKHITRWYMRKCDGTHTIAPGVCYDGVTMELERTSMDVTEALYLAEVVEIDGYRVETWTNQSDEMLAHYMEIETL